MDAEPDDLFASTSQTEKKSAKVNSTGFNNRNTSSQNQTDSQPDLPHDHDETREAALRRELAGLRSINEVIEGVVESLERAKGNMEVSWILQS